MVPQQRRPGSRQLAVELSNKVVHPCIYKLVDLGPCLPLFHFPLIHTGYPSRSTANRSHDCEGRQTIAQSA